MKHPSTAPAMRPIRVEPVARDCAPRDARRTRPAGTAAELLAVAAVIAAALIGVVATSEGAFGLIARLGAALGG
ncbi:hypothetical protein [Prosthecomicrobium pneumaticum]|uniref:Uncharacterized protein n=1 Tax=Prosthecomicrobium pneumaticum TaxID=81895 RepID=A0A7W9CVU2_9HYPH|nr:hypothetical protein [Prosthecomicrobium pneumaticum]MBB5752466.1 hypothetical protein [Prosthecomicrobium pneumaticum]